VTVFNTMRGAVQVPPIDWTQLALDFHGAARDDDLLAHYQRLHLCAECPDNPDDEHRPAPEKAK
jgi:hypothetical protein